MHSLLLVDDEKAILMSLKRLFFGHNLNLFFAEDGYDALKVLSENKIDMIISDMRMPKMDGHELLKEVQRIYPDTIRFILSGYTDEEKIYKAVMDGSAKTYLLKPWEANKLLNFVIQLFDLWDVLKVKDILKYANYWMQCPADMSKYYEINQLLNGENNLDFLTKTIEEDPWFSAKILKFGNASYFEGQIGSIDQAVMKLGRNVLRNIMFSTGTLVDIDANAEAALNYRLITTQAKKTKQILVMIYENVLNKKLLDSYIIAALLHDIGLIVSENHHIGDSLSMAKERVLIDPSLTTNHSEIGGYLLKWWGIPDSIVDSAFYHHNPLAASPTHIELVCAIHLADYYTRQAIGSHAANLELGAFKHIGIERKEFESIISPLLEI